MTSAMPARMSGLGSPCGSPRSRAGPCTSARWGSQSTTRAPMPMSRSTKNIRLSYIFSWKSTVPLAWVAVTSATLMRSAGKAGHGPSSIRGMALPRSGTMASAWPPGTTRSSPRARTSTPRRRNTMSDIRMSATPALRISISPPVAAARARKLPTSMKSGPSVKSAPPSEGTPWTTSRLEPTPSIRAPICPSSRHWSWTCGSEAALRMIVVPSASVAAARTFPVAVTLASSRRMSAPRSRSACSTRSAPSSMTAPSACRPSTWLSMRRRPIWSPPLTPNRTWRSRASSGPSRTSAPRTRRSRAGSGAVERSVRACRVMVCRSRRATSTPRPSTASSIVRTSEMSGTLRRVTGWSVRSAAPMSGKAAFLFPLGVSAPRSWTPPSMTSSSMPLAQGLVEAGDEIVGMLEADGQAQQIVGRPGGGALDRGAVLQQALGASEAGRAGEDAHLALHREGGLPPALDLHRQHPAEAGHLAPRDLVLQVGGETRVVDGLDPRVRLQECRDPQGVVRVCPHAPRQRADAAADEPAVERRRHRAAGALDRPDALEERVTGAGDDGAAHDVAVAAEVLGRGVDDQISAVGERPLQHRRRGRVVADAARAHAVGQRRRLGDVGDAPQGVRRRLHPHDLRAGRERSLDGSGVGHVDEVHGQAPRRERVAEEMAGPEVGVERRHHVIAGGQRQEYGGRRRRGRGERGGGRPTLQLGQALLERLAIGVVGAAVDVAARRRAVRLVLEGRRRVQRRRDGAGSGVHPKAGVDGQRLDSHARSSGAEPRPAPVVSGPQGRGRRHAYAGEIDVVPS